MSEESRSLPRLNEPAPDFTAETTQGSLTLSSLRGKWVTLFSHPADFTPVCTTEILEFARNYAQFQALNTQLVGLSVDSVYAHIAWLRNMEQNFGVVIPFPIIADLDMRVAAAYGMVHSGASNVATVRCVFVIDDQGMIRAMIYYPLNVGRNIGEILRLLQALQLADERQVATPANWTAGDPVILPAPRTAQGAIERTQDASLDSADWYFAKKRL